MTQQTQTHIINAEGGQNNSWRKERVLHLDQPFCFNEVSNWPYLDDKETVILELEKFVCFFMNGWKGVRLGRLGICCVKKKLKRNVLWKVRSAVWHLFFWLFGFSIFISSYQVKLGRLDLVWIDCRKFCALFFRLLVAFLLFFSLPPLCEFNFFPKNFWIFFSPKKSPVLEFACWDSLEPFDPPYFVIVVPFLCLFWSFLFKNSVS